MIREQKNKFWLTLILILSLSFSAFALGVANIFLNKKNELVASALNDNMQTQDAAQSSVSKWVKDVSGNISIEEGKTSLGILEGGSTFKIEKKSTTEFQGKEVSDIAGTAVNESQSVAYISNYTITINGVKYTPVPYYGYEVVGFDLYNKDGVKFERVTNGSFTTEQIDPEYKGEITVKAVCELIDYKAYLYYSVDGRTWNEQVETFTVAGFDGLARREEELEGNVQEFSCWAIKADMVEEDEANKVLKVGNIEFTYSGALFRLTMATALPRLYKLFATNASIFSAPPKPRPLVINNTFFIYASLKITVPFYQISLQANKTS